MLENLNLLLHMKIGFAITYLALEGGWHFTACRIRQSIPPCIFKQVKTKLIASSKTVQVKKDK
jgi:hypothetical protein